MQRCGKVNNTMIWWPRKINETKRFKVKTWGGIDLIILKVNRIHYKRIEVFTKDLTLNLMLLPVVIYWHDHVQTLNPRALSLLRLIAVQASLFVTLRSHSKVSNHLHLLILMQQLVLLILDCSFSSGRFLCS